MGTEFTAVLNHNLDERQISSLPDLFNRTWSRVEPLLPIIDGYPAPGILPSKWKWNEWDLGYSAARLANNETAMLEGHEFVFFVSKHVFKVCHAVRWSTFLTDQTVRTKLRQVSQHVAAVLGSNQIIYLPSGFLKPEGAIGLMYKGKSVDDMIDWLLENCGPAAPSIDSIDSEAVENWYYIDRV